MRGGSELKNVSGVLLSEIAFLFLPSEDALGIPFMRGEDVARCRVLILFFNYVSPCICNLY